MLLKLTSHDLSMVSISNSLELIEQQQLNRKKIQSFVNKIKKDYDVIYDMKLSNNM